MIRKHIIAATTALALSSLAAAPALAEGDTGNVYAGVSLSTAFDSSIDGSENKERRSRYGVPQNRGYDEYYGGPRRDATFFSNNGRDDRFKNDGPRVRLSERWRLLRGEGVNRTRKPSGNNTYYR